MQYQVVNQLTDNQIVELVDLYQNEFWSKNRQYQDVVKMLTTSDVIIGLIDQREQLIGFTRVLTDFVYRATIYDVIIKPSHRNKGLGAKLIDAIINHPQLITVEHLTLYCLPEMIPFYQRYGFTATTGKFEFMYRKN
ncbi:GNAT family N-acetyltransferase [Nostoc sp. TCL26-01]|uniref:GNAT family N-acetyltransferase n=1 Tax=Nostoc sp. TCL26-01 TaxID=2576904 RepID=UPI0015BB27C1|nr:GNAT family N-acetyltransferase [Nostoc sp. TCL26-01]QLE55544.1 GNAT family N-acetyltransferase [Nostoc sp. TCL26-01]